VTDNLSIILPTYNGAYYVGQQIDSILAQTFADFELIISDDASSDQTCEILDDYARRDPRIKIRKQGCNLGFKRNFEFLLREATGRYVALADQDDIWLPTHIELLMKSIGNSLLACGNCELVDSNGCTLGRTMKGEAGLEFIPTDMESQFHHLLYNNFVQGCTALISKRLIDLALPIPENVRFHDYWLASVAALTSPIVYVDETIVKYRQHTQNVIGTEGTVLSRMLKRGKPETQMICESLLSRFGPLLTDLQTNQLKVAIRHFESRYSFGPGLFCAFNTYRKYEVIYWSQSKKTRLPRILKALVGL
jgi:glycosyltransferase involved in cell wall biosynthesis